MDPSVIFSVSSSPTFLQASELLQASAILQVSAIFVALISLSVLVNVVSQFFINSFGNKPPLVFHYFPIIGSTITYGKNPMKFFNDCREKYGNVFTFILVGRRVTVYLGPEGNHYILNGKQSELSAEDVYSPLTTPVFGSGVIFDCDTNKFLQQKKFVKFGLRQSALESYVKIIEKETIDFFNTYHDFNAEPKAKTGTFEVSSAMSELTIYTASSSLQGAEVRKQFSSGEGSRIAKLHQELELGFSPINFFLPSWFPLPRNRRRDVAQREMTRIYTDIITKRRQKFNSVDASTEDEEAQDMIWNLMRNSTYKDGSKLPDKHIAHIMIALLLGGHHSSAAVVAFSILSLAYHPNLQKELYEEQARVLGDEGFSLEKLKQLKLHANVIKETLRLYNPIHSIMRLARKPLVLSAKDENNDSNTRVHLIPKGDILLASPAFSARDSAFFSNPLKWDPHRWERNDAIHDQVDDDDDTLGKGSNSPYLPFGGGRHRCIGEKFANIQLCVILALFVKTFRVTAVDKRDDPLLEIDYSSMFSRPQSTRVIWERRE